MQAPGGLNGRISSCLFGQEVRFDGGHKHDRYLTGTLGQYFQWVPLCPEVEVGLGMQRVKIYQDKGAAKRSGTGVFAAVLTERFPNLPVEEPVEEEGRLCDPRLRENWFARVFAYHALQQLWKRRWRIGNLVDFHTRYKFVLLAHDEPKHRELGRLVANARSVPRSVLRQQYEAMFMAALKRLATVRKNTNVLQHMLGYFSKQLDPASRRELVLHLADYHRGLVPLVVPLTLIRHYVRLLNVEYRSDAP